MKRGKDMKRLGFLALVLSLMVAVASVGQAAPRVFRFATEHPPNTPVSKSMAYFADLIKEKSGGSVEIRLYYSGQLGGHKEILEQMRMGTLDIVHVSTAHLASYVPEFDVYAMPFLFRNTNHYWNVLRGEIGQNLFAKLPPHNIRGLAYYDAGSRSFYVKERPINSPKDLQGLKVRVMGTPVMLETMWAMGASPVSVSFSEVYSALQSGVIDGAENNPPSVLNMKHYEVTKYFSLTEHISIPDAAVMNAKLFDSLSPELQQLILEAAAEMESFQIETWNKDDEAALETIRQAGVNINSPDKGPFIEAVRPVYDKFAPQFGGLVEAIQAVAD